MSDATLSSADYQEERPANGTMMKPPEISLTFVARAGVIGGISASFAAAAGIIVTFSDRMVIEPILTMGYALLFMIPLVTGYLAARLPEPIEGQLPPKPGRQNLIAGALAGFVSGVVTAVFLIVASWFDQEALRGVFINITPQMFDMMTFGQGMLLGSLVLIVLFTICGLVAGSFHLIPRRLSRSILLSVAWILSLGVLSDVLRQALNQLGLRVVSNIFFSSTGGITLVGAIIVGLIVFALAYTSDQRRRAVRTRYGGLAVKRQKQVRNGLYLLIAIGVLILPFLSGTFLSAVYDLVLIFTIMALGLNIVLGYAGMLDLGYVAFFAVGAYTIAVFTSPSAPECSTGGFCPGTSFWVALPFAMVMAAIAGIVVGLPVLRMRGDYLAIVTLGFGEIARLVIQSDWFKPILGGAQGIINIPDVALGPLEFDTATKFYYPAVVFVLLCMYILWRLRDARMGRAWGALREDERVAEVMGINIATTKLAAFINGAILASFAGALFATKVGSVFPSSFDIEKSIQVLIIVIVGGLGSIPGMLAGAFLIIGVPELLREFDEYRFLFYGILLVVMMLYKPEGLIPRRRFTEDISEAERGQDAWWDKAAPEKPESSAAAE